MLTDAEYYGSQWSSFWLDSWRELAAPGAAPPPAPAPASTAGAPPPPPPPPPDALPDGWREVPLAGSTAGRMRSASRLVAAGGGGAGGAPPQKGRGARVIADLAPRAMYQAEGLVELLVKCGAQHYVELKLIDGCFIWQQGSAVGSSGRGGASGASASGAGAAAAAASGGGLRPVPASRSDIFKDKSLSLGEKRSLMTFLSNGAAAAEGRGGPLASAFGAASPLAALLADQGLSAPLRDVVLYGIAMCDEPQASGAGGGGAATADTSAAATAAPAAEAGSGEAGSATAAGANGDEAREEAERRRGGPLSARGGMAALRRYTASVGRYGGGGAFMAPAFGCGSLCEAFVRCAAVHGAVTVLRQGAGALLADAAGRCAGLRTASGQVVRCGDALFACHGAVAPAAAAAADGAAAAARPRVAAAVVLLDGPAVAGHPGSALLVLPPGAAPGPAAACVVRGLQLGAGASVAPPGRWLLYLRARRPAAPDPGAGLSAEALLRPALQAVVDASSLAPEAATDCTAAAADAAGGAAPPPADAAAATASGEGAAAGSSRARALEAIFYDEEDGGAEEPALPAAIAALPNVGVCPPPAGGLAGYGDAALAAERLFRRLLPGLAWISEFEAAGTDAAGSAEDDAIEALTAAVASLAAAGVVAEQSPPAAAVAQEAAVAAAGAQAAPSP